MSFYPYASPQTPPPKPARRQANAQTFGKVLSVVAGIILLALVAFGISLFYALSRSGIAPP